VTWSGAARLASLSQSRSHRVGRAVSVFSTGRLMFQDIHQPNGLRSVRAGWNRKAGGVVPQHVGSIFGRPCRDWPTLPPGITEVDIRRPCGGTFSARTMAVALLWFRGRGTAGPEGRR
jgi:hypothetical protein